MSLSLNQDEARFGFQDFLTKKNEDRFWLLRRSLNLWPVLQTFYNRNLQSQ
jgi:hypothetical protein